MRLPSNPRRGYALVMVLTFVVLFLAMLGVAYRQTASVLRVETVRAQQAERDEGSVNAVARGLALLETGLPPSDPYVCGVTVNTTTGPRSYTVTFCSVGAANWSIQSAPTQPGELPPPMPSAFFPPSTP
jgi:hypothetical protein